MFGWLNSREREIRQLNKDAGAIVELPRQTYRAQRQREIALMTAEGIQQVAQICSGEPVCLAREVDRFKDSTGAGVSVVEAFAWDLESNYRVPRVFNVRHWRDTKRAG